MKEAEPDNVEAGGKLPSGQYIRFHQNGRGKPSAPPVSPGDV